MGKRLLDCFASDFEKMGPKALKEAIVLSEGRTILSEVKESEMPLLLDVTNAELARAVGADLILLNKLDVQAPHLIGLGEEKHSIQALKQHVKRPIGVNLEPVDPDKGSQSKQVPSGRLCTLDNIHQCQALGFDFICLTGNPHSFVSNQSIIESIHTLKQAFGGLIFAGKMHMASVNEPILTAEICQKMIKAGADAILVPAVGTIPGFSTEDFENCRQVIHQMGALCIATNGASQDCSKADTVRQIALQSKISGADVQHLGSSGPGGMTPPENILEVSIAIRGTKHTYRRMAASHLR